MHHKIPFMESTWGKLSASLIIILMAINGFFIQRLVASIDLFGDRVGVQAVQIARVEIRLDTIDKKLDHLTREASFFGGRKENNARNSFNICRDFRLVEHTGEKPPVNYRDF